MSAGPAEESLARQTSASMLWMTAQKWASRLGAFVTIVLLTRTLTSEDFGLAAAAITLMPLVYVLSDVGFSTYIVQADPVDQRTLSTAFWFSVVSGLALAVAVLASAPLIGRALDLPDVVPLLAVMSLSVLSVALSSVPISLLRRRMAFRSIALMELNSSLLAQVVALAAAFLGAGAWALVLQFMVAQLVASVWAWSLARWRPSAEFSWPKFREMAAFGVHVIGSGLTLVVRAWAETAIIIAALGLREMGFINIAQRLIQAALDLSIAALLPVSTVAFSRVRDSWERLRSSYLRGVSISNAAVTPLMLYLAVAAPVVVPFLFTESKAPSAVFLPALAAANIFYVGLLVDEGLHLGLGRPGRWFAFLLVNHAVGVAVTAYAVRWGAEAVVVTWTVLAVLAFVARACLVAPLIGSTPWRVMVPLLAVVPPAAVALAAGAGARVLLSGQPAVVSLAGMGVALVAAYLVALRVIRPRALADTVGVLPARLSSRLQWVAPRGDRADVAMADAR